MRYQVIKVFRDRGVLQLPGSIIKVPDAVLAKLEGYVMPIGPAVTYHEGTRDPLRVKSAPTEIWSLGYCSARKVGGKVCGAQLQVGNNGFLYCGDPGCQVPAVKATLTRRRSDAGAGA